jgi:ribA/ribD-fused uncharacterized protein
MRITDSFVIFYGGIYSQWYPSTFTLDGKTYCTAEQYMMEQKALFFEDEAVANAIMRTRNPMEQKALGRQVRGFDADKWNTVARGIVFKANMAKFTQNAALGDALRRTGGRVMVEASPTDRIWGVGLAESDNRVFDPTQWDGTNWLGEALMDVRATM